MSEVAGAEARPEAGSVLEFEGALRLKGELARWDGTELVVRADAPAPPGARLDAAIRGPGGPGARFKMKAIRCRKLADGRFEIALRALELSKLARAELDALAARGHPPG